MIFSDPVLFAIGLFETGAILLLFVYFIITLSDLECDYLNAQQCCEKLNEWIVPKLIVQLGMSSIFLIHGHWIITLLNMPMTVWMIYELISVPKGNLGIYDPTEIHNRGQLKRHMRNCMCNLGVHLLIFFAYLYCLIISLLKGDPTRRYENDIIVSSFEEF